MNYQMDKDENEIVAEEPAKTEEPKKLTRRTDKKHFMTMTMLVSRDFRETVGALAKERNLSTTAYIVQIMEKVIEMGGDIRLEYVDYNEKFDNINTKLDTITNLISKL